MAFDILFDDKLSVSRDLYKAFMVPTTFVIDRRGVIFKKHFGEQDWTKPELVKEIDAILATFTFTISIPKCIEGSALP